MEYSEKYGTDVDEAVRLALEELGLREDQVMVTVLEEPAKGIKGMLKGSQNFAKVRVERVDDAAGEAEDLSQAEALAAEAAAAEKPQSKATHDFRKKGRQQGAGQGGEKPYEPKRQEGSGEGESFEGREGDGRHGRRDRGGRDRDRDRGGRDRGRDRDRGRGKPVSDIEIDPETIQRVGEAIENLVPDPDNEAAKFLTDVIGKMGLEVQIEGFKNDECNFIEVKGTDSRVVIGKRGQTLDALQYLTNLVTNKGAEEYKRVIIDVEGYRSRREKTLEQLAVKLAKKVLTTGRSARLEPMNPYERKVIHATLQQVSGVSTKSEGEEPYRRVIIERK